MVIRRMRDQIREIVNEEVREALREELLQWQVGNLHGMALGQGLERQQGPERGNGRQDGGDQQGPGGQRGRGQSASFTVQVPAPGTPGSQQPPGQGTGGPGPKQILGVSTQPGQAGGGQQAGGGPQAGVGQQQQAGPGPTTVLIGTPQPGAGQAGVTFPGGGTAPLQVQVGGTAASGGAGALPAGGDGGQGRMSPQQITRLLGEAQAELVNELENNLRKLKQVIGESQEIARKLEMILGKEKDEGKTGRRG